MALAALVVQSSGQTMKVVVTGRTDGGLSGRDVVRVTTTHAHTHTLTPLRFFAFTRVALTTGWYSALQTHLIPSR